MSVCLYDSMQKHTPSQLSTQQYQQVLDAYSLGTIHQLTTLPEAARIDSGDTATNIEQVIIQTNRGLFLLVHAVDESIHQLWWGSDALTYSVHLMGALQLFHAQPLSTQHDEVFTVHRFDRRFSVFQL